MKSQIQSPWNPGRFPLVAVIVGWLAFVVCLISIFQLDHRLSEAGRDDLSELDGVGWVFLAPMLSAVIVGTALALRRPHHPVGWLFLALGLTLAASGSIDSYAAYGAVARPGSLPVANFVAVIGDSTFIPWLVLLGLIMLFTPSGKITGRPWRVAAWAVGIGGIISFVCGLLRPYHGDYADLGTIQNPIEISRLSPIFKVVGISALLVMHVGVVMGAASLVVRFRSARGEERLQLRWLGWTALPFVLFVIGAFVAATLDQQQVLGVMAISFLSIIPISAALAIEQYHLYDIEHLMSRAMSWVLLSAVLVSCYAIVVVFVGESIGNFGGDSSIPAVVATLATVSLLSPARRFLQDWLDRRFNRRRFEAIASIRRFLREPSPSRTIEEGLREALGDETLTVAYWIDERELWVFADGLAAEPGPMALMLQRQGLPVYAIAFDERQVNRETIAAVATEARSELENARLRAAITLQLVEVRESRARIVAAQLAERRKIERNLHDGAQQRLLALALQLRAAEVSQNPDRIRESVAAAADQLQAAIQELRDLANGLLPSTLSNGGLAAAFDDLVSRIPVPVLLQASDRRYPAQIEETAWFIGCEAVANAVKHASPQFVAIVAEPDGSMLRLVIEDDGVGGADPNGSGLRGITDRAEAVGGRITVDERPGHGTIIIAELPCVS